MLDFLHIRQADPDPIPLAGSPWPIMTIVVGYLLFVFKLGKVFMRNRQPYDLRKVLLVYNLFQVVYNATYFIVVSGTVRLEVTESIYLYFFCVPPDSLLSGLQGHL